MNRAIVGAIAGAALLAAAAVFVFAATERDSGPVYIEDGKPAGADPLVRPPLSRDEDK